MDLLGSLKALVKKERHVTLEILDLLARVDDSRLFAELGFSSLFEFCVKELGYSEGGAYRRVSAMRLLRREESCAEKIASGQLSLSNAARLETFFRQAKKQKISMSKARETELMQMVFHSSSEDAERKLGEAAGELHLALPGRQPRLPPAILAKVEKLQALLSHQLPYATKEEILHLVLDEAIEKHRPKAPPDPDVPVKKPDGRHIPAKLKAAVVARDGGRCTFSKGAYRCEATRFLELDHIRPLALGGKTEKSNLRLLCRTHNQLLATRAGLIRPPPNSP